MFFVVGLIGAFMTTAYMTRATYLTFFGKPRGAAAGEHAEHSDLDVAHGGSEDEYEPVPRHGRGHDSHGTVDATGTTATATRRRSRCARRHAGPHESPPLITVPLIILGTCSRCRRLPQRSAVRDREVHRVVRAGVRRGQLPRARARRVRVDQHGALDPARARRLRGQPRVCLGLYSGRRTRAAGPHPTHRAAAVGLHVPRQQVLPRRAVREGHRPRHRLSDQRGAYWFNQNVIDAIVNKAGIGTRRVGGWVYRNIDQRVVDGAVNGSGIATEDAGQALRPMQSGKVNQYGALLFGAAAIGALVLVIVNT